MGCCKCNVKRSRWAAALRDGPTMNDLGWVFLGVRVFFLEFGYRGSKPELPIIISGTVACYPKLCSGFSGSSFSSSGSGFSDSGFGFRVICPAIHGTTGMDGCVYANALPFGPNGFLVCRLGAPPRLAGCAPSII